MMRRRKVLSIVTALFLAVSGAAHANSISFSDSIGLQTTNWNGNLTVSKFDPSLGTLTGITFELTGHVQGDAKYESLDAAPATITLNLQASIALQRPDLSQLVAVIPVANVSDSAAAFDSTIDFGGPSGATFTNLSGDKTESASSPPPPSDLPLFTGIGNIILPVVATGTSNASGAGNLITQFATSASAGVKVTYLFDPATTSTTPEPGSVLLLGSGLVGLWLSQRRKQSR